MPSFRFSNRALADLEEIVAFTIQRWDPDQPEKYMRLVEEVQIRRALKRDVQRARFAIVAGLLRESR